ncbi:hypothetical protein DAEQUDRAFT_36811 [Daedalea quercina L-15889]|uniref:Uncharacterized protein n=1 Tax=Daedalea quercina L-15889 TaxID=1314783 RepID=A0A165STB6_9APHY|nr:hypothetical protein DAEQUDRAFT_36811 [Daedalea quercina L-15889]
MIAKRYDWIPEYSAFMAMMQGLPEPTDALPPRDKLRQFLKTERVGPTPRVVEVINELYGDDCVLYLSESTLWASASRHGVAIVPLYNYIANVDPQRPKWTPATLRDDVHEQVRELFYRDSNGFVVYAGTYKLVKGPELHGVTVPDHGRLHLNSNVMKMLARRTLGSSERNEAVFNMVFAGYVQGLLPFGMIALQCVGYKEGFDDALQAWSAQFARRSSDGGQPSLGVAVKAEPKTVPAPPAKRKCETEAAIEAPTDPRKRKKTGSELVIEPVASAVARPAKKALKAKAVKAAATAVKREQ